MLSIRNLSFAYNSKPVLNGVSFEVGPGRLCALLGPNGSGKTTILKCCLNQLAVRSGAIRLDGRDVARCSPRELSRLVAHVPQEHHPPFPFTTREVVLMGRTPHLSPALRLDPMHGRKVEEALAVFGLEGLAGRPYTELSGGQRQLVLLARAYAQETRLILMDEPTASLDFYNQLKIWRLAGRIAREGRTVVVTTHHPNHVLWFCDMAVALEGGRVIVSGSPGEVLTEGVLSRLYSDAGVLADHNGTRMVLPAELG